jgi:cytochrome P450 family 3 subfamily A
MAVWLVSFIVLVFLWVLYIWYSYVFKPYRLFKKLGIPGPTPRVFYGNYKQLSKFEGGVAGLESQQYLTTQYGSICGYFIGYYPYLMITDPEAIREVLVKKFDHFKSRGATPIFRFGTRPTLIDANDGEVWKRLRQVISPTFSARKLRLMESLMSRPIDRFLSRVDKVESTSSSADVHSWISELVTELLLAVFFGKAADVQGDEDGRRLVECITASFNATKTGGRLDIYKGKVVSTAFPFVLPFVKIGVWRSAIGKALTKVFDVSLKIVEERKKSSLSHNDFLQQLLGSDLTSDEVMSQVISMMFAGNETVTSALTSAAYLLAIHPDVQDKLIQEISEYFKGNPVSLHDIFL